LSTVTAIDGDNEFLMLTVDAGLNESMGLIEKGSVLRLTAFVLACFRLSNLTDVNVAILTSNFQKIARIEVDQNFGFLQKRAGCTSLTCSRHHPHPPQQRRQEQVRQADAMENNVPSAALDLLVV
jgi:hypothetical protein